MEAWWTALSTLNQTLYIVAVFFSAVFAWQLVAALVGLGGSVEVGGGGDAGAGDAGPEVDDDAQQGSIDAFKLLSIRSIIAFGMLFGWAGALYLESGYQVSGALIYAVVWGSAGMVLVSYFFHTIRRLEETGNPQLETCIGTEGEVYIDIPEHGAGQVRVTESGAVSYVSARGRDGIAIPGKTTVLVLRTLDATTVEVEPFDA